LEQRAPALQSDYEASLSTISRELADEGLTDDSVALTKLISPSTINEDLLVALVEDGNPSRAGDGLAKVKSEHVSSTLWNHIRAPQAEAAALLAQRKPGEAVRALEPAIGFEKTTFGNTYLRGEAYSQLGQFGEAIGKFKKITENPWFDPTSDLYPLSLLEMARAQARLGDTAASKGSYLQFLDLWKTADPDARQLVAAKRELAGLL
jgi:tetratricopeptide (TPR) repeat protein